MKNNIKFFLSLLMYFLFLSNVQANDQFNFDVTEIEILEEGNKIIGSKKGKVSTNDGIVIDADKFTYDRSSNILEAEGSVNFVDKQNNYKILADKIIYFKNSEVVNTYGNSRAIYKNNFTIDAEKFEFNKNTKILNAKNNVIISNSALVRVSINSVFSSSDISFTVFPFILTESIHLAAIS